MEQEKEEYKPYEPGKALTDTKLEDFDGEWSSSIMSAFGMQVPTGTLFDMQFNLTIDGGKATLVTIESGTETTTELEGDLDTNALVLKSTEEKTEEDAEDYSLFDTDTMRLYLLDDGKLVSHLLTVWMIQKKQKKLQTVKTVKIPWIGL